MRSSRTTDDPPFRTVDRRVPTARVDAGTRATEILGLPFTTYRRHLGRGGATGGGPELSGPG